MASKPPRYLLREFIVLRLMREFAKGRFLEIGYGGGDMLLSLSRLGFYGDGIDSSSDAKALVKSRLEVASIKNINILDDFPTSDRYDYIVFFELIGYLTNPVEYLRELKSSISSSGKILFSFTNKKHQGIAEKNTGEMECFSRVEMAKILYSAGYENFRIINYGYPLSNLVRPLLDYYFRDKRDSNTDQAVASSGLNFQKSPFTLFSLLINRVTLLPFNYLQLLFSNSDLGTGYLVIVEEKSRGENPGE